VAAIVIEPLVAPIRGRSIKKAIINQIIGGSQKLLMMNIPPIPKRLPVRFQL
jgi:hypothetical protein